MRIVVHFFSLYIDNGSTDDTNQMLLNISSNQPRKTTTVPIHSSFTSSSSAACQGQNEEINEDNIDDNRQGRKEEGEHEDASSHNCTVVGSTDVDVRSSTKKKLKHCYSSSTLLPPLLPRSSSTITTTSTTAAMLRQHQHPRRHTYRTLQLPVNSSNKLLIITANGQHRPMLSAGTSSENNLRTTVSLIHPTNDHNNNNNNNNNNSCFDAESVRTLSRGKSIVFDNFIFTLQTSALSSQIDKKERGFSLSLSL